MNETEKHFHDCHNETYDYAFRPASVIWYNPPSVQFFEQFAKIMLTAILKAQTFWYQHSIAFPDHSSQSSQSSLHVGRDQVSAIGFQHVLCPVHDLSHWITVGNHAINALKELPEQSICPTTFIEVYLASLLHDADDDKLFPRSESQTDHETKLSEKAATNDDLKARYPNAFGIIQEIHTAYPDFTRLNVLRMIDLVSTRHQQNKSELLFSDWKQRCIQYTPLIPRWCDRLEALGRVGLWRLLVGASRKQLPFDRDQVPKYVSKQDLVQNLGELRARYEKYSSTNPSLSVMDYFYDKLLHLVIPPVNQYMHQLFQERMAQTIDFVVAYGQNKISNYTQAFEYVRDLAKK